MNKEKFMVWLRAALIRALRTVAQSAAGMITVGAAASDVDWMQVASVALVSGVMSMLTSVAGLPECKGESSG